MTRTHRHFSIFAAAVLVASYSAINYRDMWPITLWSGVGVVLLSGAYFAAVISRKFGIPVFLTLAATSAVGIAAWGFYEAFGIKAAAITAALAIEAMAFRSLCDGREQKNSASVWLIKAFALGGLFIFCVALLA